MAKVTPLGCKNTTTQQRPTASQQLHSFFNSIQHTNKIDKMQSCQQHFEQQRTYAQLEAVNSVDNYSEHPLHTSLPAAFRTYLGGSLLASRLIQGGILLKHGHRGAPHFRSIWLTPDLKILHWGDIKQRRSCGSMDVSTMRSVLRGHQTKIFQIRAPKYCDPSLCLSLNSTGRTLDLEALSVHECEIWFISFQWLIEREHDQCLKSKTFCPHISAVVVLEKIAERFNANYKLHDDNVNMKIQVDEKNTATDHHNQLQPQSYETSEIMLQIDDVERSILHYHKENHDLLVGNLRDMIKTQSVIDDLRYENKYMLQQLTAQPFL